MEFKEIRELKSLPEAANGRHSRSGEILYAAQRYGPWAPSDGYRCYFAGSRVKLTDKRPIPGPEIIPKIREYLPDSGNKPGQIRLLKKGVL